MNGVRDPWNTASINSLGESVSKIANERGIPPPPWVGNSNRSCYFDRVQEFRVLRMKQDWPDLWKKTLASSWNVTFFVYFDRTKMGMINGKWLISDKRANMDKKITRAKRVNLLREESEDFKKKRTPRSKLWIPGQVRNIGSLKRKQVSANCIESGRSSNH